MFLQSAEQIFILDLTLHALCIVTHLHPFSIAARHQIASCGHTVVWWSLCISQGKPTKLWLTLFVIEKKPKRQDRISFGLHAANPTLELFCHFWVSVHVLPPLRSLVFLFILASSISSREAVINGSREREQSPSDSLNTTGVNKKDLLIFPLRLRKISSGAGEMYNLWCC